MHYIYFTPTDFRDSNPPDLIGRLPIWCVASRSPDCYQILPIYNKIVKKREKNANLKYLFAMYNTFFSYHLTQSLAVCCADSSGQQSYSI